MEIVLASSSRYRAQALTQLGLPFTVDAADVDETPREAESARDLAARLSAAKADAVAARHPGALVIGSDQVGEARDRLLNKPGNPQAARTQLAMLSGQTAVFHTGLCLRVAAHRTVDVVATHLQFRKLAASEIAHYVDRDQAWDCAGSFKVEALGISLFEYVRADDPSALVGLPLIMLCTRLRAHGINPLA